jgi:hypothetical protein
LHPFHFALGSRRSVASWRRCCIHGKRMIGIAGWPLTPKREASCMK